MNIQSRLVGQKDGINEFMLLQEFLQHAVHAQHQSGPQTNTVRPDAVVGPRPTRFITPYPTIKKVHLPITLL